jgi:hypothetical protein
MVKPIAKHRAIEFDARNAPHLSCGFVNARSFFVSQDCIFVNRTHRSSPLQTSFED